MCPSVPALTTPPPSPPRSTSTPSLSWTAETSDGPSSWPVKSRSTMWRSYVNARLDLLQLMMRFVCFCLGTRFKATLWLSESHPLSLAEQVTPIIDLMAISNAHFAKLRDFITLRLPPGFPVKIGGYDGSLSWRESPHLGLEPLSWSQTGHRCTIWSGSRCSFWAPPVGACQDRLQV